MPRQLREPLAIYVVLILLAFAGLFMPAWRPVSAIAASLVGILLVACFHELGHGLVAVTQGYRFLFMVVGPLRLEETPNGPRVLINRSWEYAGGVCACSPDRVPDERLRRTHMLQYLAGPLMSLAIAAAVFAVGGRNLPLPAALMAAASFGIGAASLIPSRQGALISDGLGFLTLHRGGSEAERLLHRVRLAAAVYATARPAAWPERDVAAITRDLADQPVPPTDPGWQSQLNDRAVLYYHLVDCGEIERAGTMLAAIGVDVSAARARSVTVQSIVLQNAFHIAWYDKDAVLARRWFSLVTRVSPMLESDRQRALAAILSAEGARDGAKAALDRARSSFPAQLSGTSVGAMELQWLTQLAQELE